MPNSLIQASTLFLLYRYLGILKKKSLEIFLSILDPNNQELAFVCMRNMARSQPKYVVGTIFEPLQFTVFDEPLIGIVVESCEFAHLIHHTAK